MNEPSMWDTITAYIVVWGAASPLVQIVSIAVLAGAVMWIVWLFKRDRLGGAEDAAMAASAVAAATLSKFSADLLEEFSRQMSDLNERVEVVQEKMERIEDAVRNMSENCKMCPHHRQVVRELDRMVA
jgi:methyl-accepting chemotaxis protein